MLGFARFQAAAVQREGLGQRRLIEDLPVHPGPVRVAPLLAAAPDAAVAQQHRVQPLLHPLAVIEQVPAGAHQVADRLLGRGRHPDRRQQPARWVSARRTESRLSVLTRSEAPLEISDGATKSQATPIEASSRCSS